MLLNFENLEINNNQSDHGGGIYIDNSYYTLIALNFYLIYQIGVEYILGIVNLCDYINSSFTQNEGPNGGGIFASGGAS